MGSSQVLPAYTVQAAELGVCCMKSEYLICLLTLDDIIGTQFCSFTYLCQRLFLLDFDLLRLANEIHAQKVVDGQSPTSW